MARDKGSIGPDLPKVFLTWNFLFWDVRPDSRRFGESNLTGSTPKIFGTHETQRADITLSAGGRSGATDSQFRQRQFIGQLTDDARGEAVELRLEAPPGVKSDIPAGPHLEFRDAKWNGPFEVQMRSLLFNMEVDPDGYFIPPEAPGILSCFVDEAEREKGLAPHGYIKVIDSFDKDGTRIQDVLVDWKFDALKRFKVKKFYARENAGWVKDPATGKKTRKTFDYTEHYLVLHVTTGDIIGSQFQTFINAKSIHYLVDVDGHVVKMLPEEKGAHHAGWQSGSGFRAGWRTFDYGRWTDANKTSIGIEHVQFEGVEWWQGQINGSVRIVREICDHFGILPCDVVRHRDLAVHKKTWAHGHTTGKKKGKGRSKHCPGLKVPWKRYQDEDLAIGPVEGIPISMRDMYQGIFEFVTFIDDELENEEQRALQAIAIEQFQHDLRRIGYWCPVWAQKNRRKAFGETRGTLEFGTYDEATEYAVLLSQEKFMEMRGNSPLKWGKADILTAGAIFQVAANDPAKLPFRPLPNPK